MHRADEGPYLGTGRWALSLLGAGFSLSDIEKLADAEDVRTVSAILDEVQKQNDIARLRAQLDTAEAVNHAMVGSTRGEGAAAYARWLRQVEGRIMRLQGVEVPTVWDRMPRRGRRTRLGKR